MARLTRSDEIRDGVHVVHLSGVFDERADEVDILPRTELPVIYELSGLTRISSYGALHWHRSLLHLKVPYYGFAHVRPFHLRQFNMVAGYGVRGELLSFYVPYECDGCQIIWDSYVDVAAEHEALRGCALADELCPQCGEVAPVDGAPEVYLNCFARSQPPRPPAAVQAYLLEQRNTTTREVTPLGPPPAAAGTGND